MTYKQALNLNVGDRIFNAGAGSEMEIFAVDLESNPHFIKVREVIFDINEDEPWADGDSFHYGKDEYYPLDKLSGYEKI